LNARNVHKILKKRGYTLKPTDDSHLGVFDKHGNLVAMTLMPGRKSSKEITHSMKRFLRSIGVNNV